MNRTFLLFALVMLTASAVFGFADFDHKPIGPFVIDQNETFIYDFNSTYTNGSPGQVPEDGTVSYDLLNEELSQISGSSVFSFNASNGLLNYTPSNADATKNFTIRFFLLESDEDPSLDEVIVRFDIQNVNDPPEITSSTPATPISTSENETINLTLNATDPDRLYGEVLNATWTIERPINATYTETAELSSIPGQGNLSYVVGFCDAGALNITGAAVDDEGLNDTVSWVVNVANVNRNVTFNSTANITNQTFNESQGLVTDFTYDQFFHDPDDLVCEDETLTFTLDGASETNLSINQTSGEVRFNATSFWSGNETVTITAIDAEGSSVTSNTFTLEVLPIPDDPIGIDPGNRTAYEDVAFEMFVRFEDPDLPYGDNLSYALNSTAIGTSTLSLEWHNITGNASYARISVTPAAADTNANYSYRLTANDSTNREANVTFTIEVEPNSAPTITSPIVLGPATQGENYSALINGTEPDGEAISWFVNSSIFGTTLNGTVGAYPIPSVNDTQANLSFEPDNDDVGNYTFTIFARDPKGAMSNESGIAFEVINVNDPPESLEPSDETLKAKTGEEWNYTATVDDPDFPYGDFVTISVNDTNITITNTTTDGSQWFMSWTPSVPDVGNRTIELNATDSDGASITETFTLEVLEPTAPTILPIENLTIQATIEYFNRIQATDPNGDSITFTIDNPIWGNYATPVGTNATIINHTYDANDADNSPYTINVTASDVDGNTSVEVEFVVEPFNLAPNLTDARDIFFVVGNSSTFNFTVQDAEDDTWNAFFETSLFDWITVTKVNATLLQLSGTPNVSHVGANQDNLTINQTDYPPRNTTYLFNVTVFSDPQNPLITARDPTFGLNPSATEGGSRTFSVTVDDPNFPGPGSNESDAVSVEWRYNDEQVKLSENVNQTSTIEYLFEYDYCLSPGGTLEVIVTDKSNLTNTTNWSLAVTNVNRAPYFGEKRFSYDVMRGNEDLSYATGSWTRTNVDLTGTELEQKNASVIGTIESAVFDLGRENSINKATIENVSITGSGPVFYELRFNTNSPNLANPSWSNWTEPVAVGEPPANYTIRKYLQIRFTLNSTNAASLSAIENATLHYSFANRTVNSSSTLLDYYYLDDYFTDPDFEECTDETLNVTVEPYPGRSAFTIDVDIDEQSRTVDLITETSFGYIEYPMFTYTDASGANVSSDEYGIEIVERPDQLNEPQPTSGGGGGGGSSTSVITEPEPQEVPEPEPLEIVTPGAVTMYANQTLSIPISIVNNWNETLEGITMSAESENENTTLSLGVETIPALAAGENRTFNLTVTSYDTYGDYAIRVFAAVNDPEYNGSATILISSIELGAQGNETFNTKLSFTRDIVESNPRCLELNEQIERASELITGGATAEAATLLDDIVENCRYLISLDDATLDTEERGLLDRFMNETSTETKVYAAVILLVNTLLIGLVAVYLFRRKPGAS